MNYIETLEMIEVEMQFLRDRLAQLGQIRARLKKEIIPTSTQTVEIKHKDASFSVTQTGV